MSQSLAKIVVHIAFSTKHRKPVLCDRIRPNLFRYLAGTLTGLDSPAIQVGGTADHVHLLCRLSKNMAAAELIKEVKKASSKWLKRQDRAFASFHWQTGYGCFSIGQSGVRAAQRYILRQEIHHRKDSFQDEFRELLHRYEIPYDEEHVWD